MTDGGAGADVTQTETFKAAVAAAVATEVAASEKGLRANRDDILREKKAADERLKAFDGVDVDEFNTLKAAAAEAAEKKAKAEGDFESLKQQMVDLHAGELGKRDDKIKSLSGALETYLIDRDALTAIAKHTPNVDLLLPHVRSDIRVVEKDGAYKAVVVDGTGNERVMQDPANPSNMIPMTIDALVESKKQTFPSAFPGSGGSGSGTQQSQHSDTGGVTKVDANDNKAFLENLEGIAKGTVKVE